MKPCISWWTRDDEGIKREVRAYVSRGNIKWQFKRSDQDGWDYDSKPLTEDWDALEEKLVRSAGRGRAMGRLEAVQKIRKDLGV